MPNQTVLRVVGQNLGGGARIHVYQLNRRLEAEGRSTLTIIPRPGFPDKFTAAELVPFNYNHETGLINVLRHAARLDPRIDYIHSHLRNATALAGIAALRYGLRHVITVHTPLVSDGISFKDRIFRWLLRAALKRASLVIFISDYLAKLTLGQLGLSSNDVTAVTIYNGSDPVEGDFDRANSGILRVCLVGELTDRKGMPDLIKLVRNLNERAQEGLLIIEAYGDGPWRENLEIVAAQTGLLALRGYKADSREIYLSSDVNLMLGRTEGFGRTITEAKSAALPTVAFDSGAFPEIVHHGIDGFLEQSVERIADRLIELANNRDMLSVFQTAALEDHKHQFTVDAFTGSTLAAIDGIQSRS
ncbi:glycosyltransferase [Sphingomonas koreensis]|nr:glycosyltransferase [Sphingomonas koreensis]